jgi:hypothetical protein
VHGADRSKLIRSDSLARLSRLRYNLAMATDIQEYRKALLSVLARLDQLVTEADAILAAPGDAEIYAMAEDMREGFVAMQAKVESKLDRGEP